MTPSSPVTGPGAGRPALAARCPQGRSANRPLDQGRCAVVGVTSLVQPRSGKVTTSSSRATAELEISTPERARRTSRPRRDRTAHTAHVRQGCRAWPPRRALKLSWRRTDGRTMVGRRRRHLRVARHGARDLVHRGTAEVPGPGVTLQLGLGIGRLVFRALNTCELVLGAAVIWWRCRSTCRPLR